MQIDVATEIAAPPETVFDTVADVSHWPDFVRGIERVEFLTPGGVASGVTFRETRIMFRRSATEDMTIAVLSRPRRFELTAENHGTRYVIVHDITPASGGSRLQLTFEGTPITFAAKLGSVLALLFKGAVIKQLRSDLDDVKAEAERRARR
jgi:hypothetical protein